MPQIEFHCPPQLLDMIPHPAPASRHLPDWMRAVPTHLPDQTPTVKNCMPFLEAMNAGYVIALPTDITFVLEADRLRVDVAEFGAQVVGFHNGDQVLGAPYGGTPIVKFHTPWVIRTPAGYSTLVLPPVNRLEIPFLPLTGLVETDTYYRQIAYPTLCTMRLGQTVKLARGTPLVQVVPVLREAWTSSVGAMDVEANKAQEAMWEGNRHMYREEHWEKKSFR